MPVPPRFDDAKRCEIAQWVIDNRASIGEAAEHYGTCYTVMQRHMGPLLQKANLDLYMQVRQIHMHLKYVHTRYKGQPRRIARRPL